MAGWRQTLELTIGDEDLRLRAIARSCTEPASRVELARMLLAYREDPSFFARRPGYWGAPSDCAALRRAGCCLWSVDGAR